jgi:hypothetical protein
MLERISGKGHRKPSSSPEVRANTLARNLLSNVRSVLGLEIGNSPSTSARTSGIPLPQNRLLGRPSISRDDSGEIVSRLV